MAHDDLVCPPPVSACDHPPRRLAVCAFHAQLSRRRRSACGARSGYLLRNGAAMGFEVWAVVRPRASPSTPTANIALEVKLMRKLLKKQGFAPDVLVTDKLRSYGAAKAEIGLSARHDQGLRANNRVENSHQPTRRRERKMQRFKSPGSAQRFLSIHAAVQNAFNVQRHLTSRRTLRVFREEAFRTWQAATAA